MGGPVRRPPAAPVIVGRDAERAQLAEFLEGRTGLVAALVTGPAGIGKTALWEWTLEQAASLGYLVLVSRAGVAEVRLPWVGLTDLLRPVPYLDAASAGALRFALRRMGSADRVRLVATAR